MEPNIDRMQWSVVALLAAIVIGGVVMLAFPKISGKIANNMDESVEQAFKGDKPGWMGGTDSEDNDKDEEKEPEKPKYEPGDLFTYKEIEGGYSITGFNEEYIKDELAGVQPVEIELPGEYKGKNVVEVASMAFAKKGLTDVKFAANIKKLDSNSFRENNLKNLTIPKTIERMEFYVFRHSNVENLTLEPGLKQIGKQSLADNKITNLVVPSSVDAIQIEAFKDNKINNITFQGGDIKFGTGAFENNELAKIKLPSGNNAFESRAFANNKIKTIDFGDAVNVILKNEVFMDNQIETLVVADNVTKIGARTFMNNPIKKLVIGKNVKDISTSAFENNVLESLEFKDGALEDISTKAFKTKDGHNPVLDIKLPNKLRIIGASTFGGISFSNLELGDNIFRMDPANGLTPAAGATVKAKLKDTDSYNEAKKILVINKVEFRGVTLIAK